MFRLGIVNPDWRLMPGVPMWWTTGDRTIVAAFNSEDDRKFKTRKDLLLMLELFASDQMRTHSDP